jgi:acyl carrier protein
VVVEELLRLIERHRLYRGTEVRLDSRLVEELGFDSASLHDLILAIEKHYGVTFTDEQLTIENFLEPGRILGLLEATRGASGTVSDGAERQR